MRGQNFEVPVYRRLAFVALLALAASAMIASADNRLGSALPALGLAVAGLAQIFVLAEHARWRTLCGVIVAAAGAVACLRTLLILGPTTDAVQAPLKFLNVAAVGLTIGGAAIAMQRLSAGMVRIMAGIVGTIGMLAFVDFLVTLGERQFPGIMSVSLPMALGFLVLSGTLLANNWGVVDEISLNGVLGGLVIAALMPALVFMVAQSQRINAQHLEAIKSSGASAVDDIAQVLSTRIEARIALLQGLSTSPALHAGSALMQADAEIFRAQAKAAVAGTDSWIIVTDGAGRQLINSRYDFNVGDSGRSNLPEPSIGVALQTGQPLVSDLHVGVTRKHLQMITISYPIQARGLVVNLRMPIGELTGALQGISPEGWIYAVADRGGLIVARNLNADQWIGKPVSPSAWRKSRSAASGWDRTLSVEGTPVFTTWKQLPWQWTALAGVDEARVDVAANRQNQRLVLEAILMTFIGLMFAAVGAYLISRPLMRFASNKDDTSGANSGFGRSAIREINVLANTLMLAERDRKQATQVLADSQARLQRFVDQTPAAIAMFDNQMRYMAASKRWQLYFDRQIPDLVGKSLYDLNPGLTETWRSNHRRGLAGETLQADNEVFPRADGIEQILRWELRPWHTIEGAIGGITIYAEDVTERTIAERALRESEARLKAIVDTATDAIVVISAEGHIESFNASAENMFGYRADEAIGKNVAILMADRFAGEVKGGVVIGRSGAAIEFLGAGREATGLRKDGTTVPVELSVAQWSVGGESHFTGIMRDITSRKERENHVRLVMRELSHRTKNTLAVVQAMAWQTSRTTNDAAEFQLLFTQRVEGLSRSIGLLVRNDWEGVEVEALVRNQLAPFLDGAQKLVVNGSQVVLKPNAAQDLGLVLHELATNALKYGALSAVGGCVDARWELTSGDDGAQVFEFDWREYGGPSVEQPIQIGFGSTLIRDMLAKTYNAKIVLAFEPNGLLWRLRVHQDRFVASETRVNKGRDRLVGVVLPN